MGTWGATAFEDDTAMSFYDEYCLSKQNLSELIFWINTVLEKNYSMDDLGMDGFLDPVKALVCAEIFAAALGKPINTFPDLDYHAEMELPKLDLQRVRSVVDVELKIKTKNAIAKIRETEGIHLTNLWFESESKEEWQSYLNDLIQRIE